MVVKKTTSGRKTDIDPQFQDDAPMSKFLIRSMEAVDIFCDACWLEDGLSKNTLSAYRQDLNIFSKWLDADRHKFIYDADAADVMAYIAHRRSDKATTANRRLTVLRRFYRLGIRKNLIKADPCLNLRAAKQAPRCLLYTSPSPRD